MKDFEFAFYGEGGRDYAFPCEIARRAIEQLLLPRFIVTAFPIPKFRGGLDDKQQLAKLVNDYYGYRLFIVHYDADRSMTEHVRKTRFDPAYEPVKPADKSFEIVPVIPVRNTEAWILADFNAFASVTGLKGKAEDYGFPPVPHQVEADQDTKSKIDTAFRAADISAKAEADLLREIAKNTELIKLKTVPAFAEFEQEIVSFLKSLQYIE